VTFVSCHAATAPVASRGMEGAHAPAETQTVDQLGALASPRRGGAHASPGRSQARGPALERCSSGALAASVLTAPASQAAHTVVHVPPARRASFEGPPPSAARELDFPVSHGLASPEADRLLRLHGRNELEERSKPKWLLFLEQFYAPMPCMLWLACLIELLIQDWTDFWILLSLQLINASVSFYEASRAGDAVAALKAALKPSATAKRDGRWVTLAAAELVPGDLVMLGAGAAVPADCVVNGGAIDVDQAALTGESLPVALCAGDRPKMGSTVRRMAHAVLRLCD